MANRRARSSSFRLGLRGKLALISLAWVCIPLLVVWGAGVYEGLAQRSTARDVRDIAEVIDAAIVAESLTANELVGRASWLRELGEDEQVMIRVLDSQGTVLHDTNPGKLRRFSGVRRWYHSIGDFFFGPSGPPDLLAFETTLLPERDREEVKSALHGVLAATQRTDAKHRMVIDYRAIPIPNEGGAVYLTHMSRRSILALYDMRYQLLKLTLVLALVATLLGIWLGRRFVSPVINIQRQIRAYVDQESPAEFAPEQLSMDRKDEIGDLCRDFRALTERLQSQVQRTSELAADLAHDIKNPIATVSASSELLESSKQISSDRQQRIAVAMADAALHMNRSVEGMLRLAKLDQSLASSKYVPLDFSEALAETIEGYETLALAQGVKIDTSIEAGLNVRGMHDELIVLIRNLVDNAMLFSASQVHVGLKRENADVVLVVEDDGPGVSEGNREKLFRRFFTHRPDSAPLGTGLGLAISSTIATAHGGALSLATTGSLAGAAFILRIPAHLGAQSSATQMPH